MLVLRLQPLRSTALVQFKLTTLKFPCAFAVCMSLCSEETCWTHAVPRWGTCKAVICLITTRPSFSHLAAKLFPFHSFNAKTLPILLHVALSLTHHRDADTDVPDVKVFRQLGWRRGGRDRRRVPGIESLEDVCWWDTWANEPISTCGTSESHVHALCPLCGRGFLF